MISACLATHCTSQPIEQFAVTMYDNRIYAPSLNASIGCAGVNTFQQWMATGFDTGSQIFEPPSIDQLLEWGRQILGM